MVPLDAAHVMVELPPRERRKPFGEVAPVKIPWERIRSIQQEKGSAKSLWTKAQPVAFDVDLSEVTQNPEITKHLQNHMGRNLKGKGLTLVPDALVRLQLRFTKSTSRLPSVNSTRSGVRPMEKFRPGDGPHELCWCVMELFIADQAEPIWRETGAACRVG
jgi:hypothetical protein